MKQATSRPDVSAPDPEEKVIVDRIYTAVMEQRLTPKMKLSESALCESFGVGRMRARRALLLLASQGIVDLHSNRGAFVASPSPEEAVEVFETRIMIEPALIEKIVENIKPMDLAELRGHIEEENQARAASERTSLIRLSGEFHVKLAAVTGLSTVTRMIKELVTRTSLTVGLFGNENASACPDDEHAEILDVIENRDSDLAERLARRHLEHIRDALDFAKPQNEQPNLSELLGMK